MIDPPDFSDDAANPEDYVGYGSPPKRTRWKKNHCPNPRGRPSNRKSRRQYLVEVAFRPIEITDGGRPQRMSQLAAMILLVKGKAIAGHSGASRLFEKLQGLEMSDAEAEAPPKGVFIRREKLTREEWFAKYTPDYDEATSSTAISSPLNPTD